MAPSTPARFVRLSLLLPALTLAACNSTRYVRVVNVNPADATVYINGERVGKGASRPYTFDFSEVDRIYVQATHPEYHPELEVFDRERIEQMVAANLDVKLVLRQR